LNVDPAIADVGPLAHCRCDLIDRVRADERAQAMVQNAVQQEWLRAVIRADLHDRVEALPSAGLEIPHGARGGYVMVRRADVLAMLDGNGHPDAVEPLTRVDERVDAWEAVATHPTLKPAYSTEGALLPAVLARLTYLGELERLVVEMSRSPGHLHRIRRWFGGAR